MDTARIAALLDPFLDHPLAPAQLDQTLMYINLLLRWNARVNLTAIREPDQIVTRHFGESFFLARHLFPTSNPCHPEQSRLPVEGRQFADRGPHRSLRVLDLGSGAGFPGLPLKIWAPSIHLALIESNHKKAAFLREVVRALTLTNVNVFAERAESLAARLASPFSVPRSSPAVSQPLVAPEVPPTPTAASAAIETVRSDGAPLKPSLGRYSVPADGAPDAPARPKPAPADGPAPLADADGASFPGTEGARFGGADLVTFRAVEKFDRILPLAARFLAHHGRLAILVSSAQLPKLRAIPGMKWQTINVPQSQKSALAVGELA